MSSYTHAQLRKMVTDQKIPGRSKLTTKASMMRALGLGVDQPREERSDNAELVRVVEALSLESQPSPQPQTKSTVAQDLIHRSTLIYQQAQTYHNFLAWLNQMLYIEELKTSDRYTLKDLLTYDVEAHYTDDIVIEFETGLRLFYTLCYPAKYPSDDKIATLAERYSGNKELVFQKLYRKYIKSTHVVITTPSEDIMVL